MIDLSSETLKAHRRACAPAVPQWTPRVAEQTPGHVAEFLLRPAPIGDCSVGGGLLSVSRHGPAPGCVRYRLGTPTAHHFDHLWSDSLGRWRPLGERKWFIHTLHAQRSCVHALSAPHSPCFPGPVLLSFTRHHDRSRTRRRLHALRRGSHRSDQLCLARRTRAVGHAARAQWRYAGAGVQGERRWRNSKSHVNRSRSPTLAVSCPLLTGGPPVEHHAASDLLTFLLPHQRHRTRLELHRGCDARAGRVRRDAHAIVDVLDADGRRGLWRSALEATGRLLCGRRLLLERHTLMDGGSGARTRNGRGCEWAAPGAAHAVLCAAAVVFYCFDVCTLRRMTRSEAIVFIAAGARRASAGRGASLFACLLPLGLLFGRFFVWILTSYKTVRYRVGNPQFRAYVSRNS